MLHPERERWYRVILRATGEAAVVKAASAAEACAHQGWMVGDCFVRTLYAQPAEVEEEARLLRQMDDLPADRQGEKGQALAEAAIILPLVCALLIGACVVGICLSDKASIDFAARVAAVWAAGHPGEEEQVCDKAIASATVSDPDALGCSATWDNVSVLVEMTYAEPLSFLWAGPLVLRSRALVPR